MTVRSLRCVLAITAVLTLISSSRALGQANYTESFQGVGDGTSSAGGPPVLVSRGWLFRNQSRPAGSGNSPYWTEFPGWGQVGSGLGHGGFAVWQNSSSRISAWAILPAIPNQRAGDPLTLWTSAPTNAFGDNAATLEIRYSASGATGTGSNETDVGNFSTLLMSVSGAGGHPWTERSMVLPGTGRIALRLVLGPVPDSFSFSGSFIVDSLQVGAPPAAQFPLPTAGQTVHWTTAMSPIQLSTNANGQSPRIVPTGVVIVDAGVRLQLGQGVNVDISGTLDLRGTGASPVLLRGNGRMTVANGGFLTAEHADVETFTDLIYGGRASFSDSTFRDPSLPTGFSYDSAGDIGHRVFDGNLDYARQVLSLSRCTFAQGCDVAILRGWVAARDCTFFRGGVVTTDPTPVGGEAMFIVGNAILQNVTATESYIDLMADKTQRRFVGNVTVTGNSNREGLRLEGGGNYLIDPSVTLQGNKWPVAFGGNSAGILPGSQLPATGNEFNEIPTGADSAPLDEKVVWADAGVPYVVYQDGTLRGQITILPGVTVKMMPDAVFFFDTDSNGYAMPVFLGEPERPVRFEPYVPGSPWYSIVVGGGRWFGTRWDWCIFEGGRFGVGASQMPLGLDNCIFRNNIRALYSESYLSVRKCTFENNVYSITGERFAPVHEVRGFLNANHPTNPNTFVNNRGNPAADFFGSFLPNGGLIARARHNSLENTDSDVRNNWWGTPTGPHEPRNPGGTGDDVFFGIDSGGFLLPFLTQAPTPNSPPTVRFITSPIALAVPGEKIIVQWTARDDGPLAAQRVYYSADSNPDSAMQLIAQLPADARSFEWTVPVVGFSPSGPDQFLRVVAVDSNGQEGIADLPMVISDPSQLTGSMTLVSPAPGLYRPGTAPQACASLSGVVGSMYAAIELDNDDSGVSLGGVFQSGANGCTVLNIQLPDVSTDRARIRFDATASLNQVKSFYGPYFSIRPDPLLADAAPAVTLTSTHAGAAYPGGSVIPITWTASDDEALRSFDIRASYDGGTRWFIVARDLPSTQRSFAWQLPGSTGIPSVRIRVVAWDRRFQNSSAESGVFAITPGTSSLAGDIDGNGLVNTTDLNLFINVLLGAERQALLLEHSDLNSDGLVNGLDIQPLLAAMIGA